jgi:hypothetical protein
MKNPIILTALLLGLGPTSAVFGQSKVGTTAAPFLEIGVGARNIAIGEAAVSVVEDVSSLYWNPSGIARMSGGEVTFQYTEWFADTRLQFAAGAVNVGNMGAVGIHFYAFESGEMDVRTIEFEEGTGETFSVQDVSFGLSYARLLTDNFSIGGTAKFIRSKVWRMSASSLALDLGVLYDMPVRNLRLGFSISNFGGDMRLNGDNTTVRVDLDPIASGDNDGILSNLSVQSWNLPLLFRIGLAYDVFSTSSSRLTVASDASYPNNNDQFVNVGAEYGFMNTFFVRAGYSNLFLPDTEGRGHLRAGFGVNVAGILQADYAFSERGDLGKVNTIGATLHL